MSNGVPGVLAWTYTGAGAAINKELGFIPAAALIVNETDGGSFLWCRSMTAAHVAQLDDGSHDSSNGITVYAGTSGDKKAGLTIGTGLAVNAKKYHITVWRGEVLS